MRGTVPKISNNPRLGYFSLFLKAEAMKVLNNSELWF